MGYSLSDGGLAQQIVSGKRINFDSKENFGRFSGIYMKSNERIEQYHHYLVKREKILSVIASGDQILNAILEGTKKVDCFDVSIFPKYLLYLKIGAVKTLKLDEYIKFFYIVDNNEDLFFDYYDRIRVALDDKVCMFWDGLLDYFTWNEVVESSLFIGETVIWQDAVKQNKYLSNVDDYSKLRSVIGKVNISTYDGDFLNIAKGFKDSYDLIYLSNIIYYVQASKYLKCLEGLHLKENGVSLTYFYGLSGDILRQFGDRYSFDKFENSKNGVLVFRNK